MSLLETVISGTSPEYSSFLAARSDSAPTGDFVLLYGQSDLPERNETFEIHTYLPGWVAIGDDGGGTAILMRLDGSSSVYRCGHGAIGSLDPELVADSFARWLADDCPASWMDDDDDYGDD